MGTSWPAEWPTTPRQIAVTTDAAINAARSADGEQFVEKIENLRLLPFEQVTLVHAGVVRALLEDLHPDGFSGDDIQDALTRVAGAALVWLPGLDISALAAVLTGSLGLTEMSDDAQRIGQSEYLRSAVLVMTDLLATADASPYGYLKAAIAEIARAETVEMP
ncbi:hypothetical protein [Prescottella equi]|uniref:Uncharacterized protein n=1 Tax=Rhodococcus hoagii TaxID=43767 RepID=A0AAE5CE02_RHOHA|nr:hypothetical protein [Prescottella equi]MBM4634885.1 hypothetical protein [Prescottella equi]NKS25345.1 hypothetical protein [Prescottella equi]UNQ35253.1 hypothetical protein MPC39_01055 [Prescottella equi]